tara:strand:+ start:56 stop:220 length:165 start_codon:yes stop_codon:yes gene_type:complete
MFAQDALVPYVVLTLTGEEHLYVKTASHWLKRLSFWDSFSNEYLYQVSITTAII